jgi:Adenylate cyclase, class 2 (thermophilic)
MFEVEARGELTVSLDQIIKRFRKLNAKFLGKTRRFSLIYLRNKSADKNDPIDLRIRVTNGKSEIVLKYGKWGAFDNREEVAVPIDTKDFSDAVEMLKLLGLSHGIINVNDRCKFRYKGIEFVFVDNGIATYFEAERLIKSRSKIEKERNYVTRICNELGMKPFNDDEFYSLIDKINGAADRQFDLNNERFEDIKNKFKQYFYASKERKRSKSKNH